MILKYMYMIYVCVRRFCPLVDRLERPDGAGEDAAAGDGGGKKSAEDGRRTGTDPHTVEPKKLNSSRAGV
ncbi:hypothetical protein HanXRQr2_Chr01g0025611 [Helianthus annuus]|uniref:Uncharacterized protein n=1 Tax=Helianthus annuus TaxID=4232 RepID=A0A9K3JWM9_HELAN|nr:hypothetical protein HanXRQr2_Chr01g0025611 [Helianthus annuus]KAJ0783513.1 hypothetical protein HanLR1_Chr01g0021191 [Helianthus annuus]